MDELSLRMHVIDLLIELNVILYKEHLDAIKPMNELESRFVKRIKDKLPAYEAPE
jgi:hypothetical protein